MDGSDLHLPSEDDLFDGNPWTSQEEGPPFKRLRADGQEAPLGEDKLDSNLPCDAHKDAFQLTNTAQFQPQHVQEQTNCLQNSPPHGPATSAQGEEITQHQLQPGQLETPPWGLPPSVHAPLAPGPGTIFVESSKVFMVYIW